MRTIASTPCISAYFLCYENVFTPQFSDSSVHPASLRPSFTFVLDGVASLTGALKATADLRLILSSLQPGNQINFPLLSPKTCAPFFQPKQQAPAFKANHTRAPILYYQISFFSKAEMENIPQNMRNQDQAVSFIENRTTLGDIIQHDSGKQLWVEIGDDGQKKRRYASSTHPHL